MDFRVVVAGESSMYVLSRAEALKSGDLFELPGVPGKKLRVREISYDPVGDNEFEFLIAAERAS